MTLKLIDAIVRADSKLHGMRTPKEEDYREAYKTAGGLVLMLILAALIIYMIARLAIINGLN